MLMCCSFIQEYSSLANAACARQNPTDRQGCHSRYYTSDIVQ